MKGRIVKILSNTYMVLINDQLYECLIRGRFRKDKITLAVGDIVKVDLTSKMIEDVYKRHNHLKRPSIANIDQVLIVISAVRPKFDTNLLDKLIVMTEFNNIKPIIVITKLDLLNRSQLKIINQYLKYYRSIGYKIYKNTNLWRIKRLFKNKVSVLAGQSGAGKSTLLNRLNIKLELQTAEISEALGRGKHTTRHVELIPMFNGLVADTPGFSALDLTDMTIIDIKQNFVEFYQIEEQCAFKNCTHRLEHNCKVKEFVESNKILNTRYDNYLKFAKEVEGVNKWS